MITNRSNHADVDDDRQREQGSMLVRAFLNQKTCGLITLQLDRDPVGYGQRARGSGMRNLVGTPAYSRGEELRAYA
jgi:hypothetical protein